LNQRHEVAAQGVEHSGQVAAFGSGLVVLQQGVVGCIRVTETFGLAPLERHHAVEPRPEADEVRVAAGGQPCLLGQRDGAGQLRDQRARQPGGAVVGAAQLAHVDGRGGQRIAHQRRALQFGEELADARVGGAVVFEAGQQRHLLPAVLGPAARHVRLLVPAQEHGARTEQRLLAHAPGQFVVSRLDSHRGPPFWPLARSRSDPGGRG
jgi:hypothetical protein